MQMHSTIQLNTHQGILRQYNESILHVTDKAFSIAGPRAWNALPSDMKVISSCTTFRKKLKTHFLVSSSLNFY